MAAEDEGWFLKIFGFGLWSISGPYLLTLLIRFPNQHFLWVEILYLSIAYSKNTFANSRLIILLFTGSKVALSDGRRILSAPGKWNALIFYPPKSNSNSILILIWFFRILNYNLDSNLTNCVSLGLKLQPILPQLCIKLDYKTLFEDNAELWQYWLWNFKSGDTQLVRLDSKL